MHEPDLDQLLIHREWLRHLARRLTRDVHLAEDLAQGTLAAALDDPGRGTRPRRWFAGVLRNLWRQHHRRERVRSRNEAAAARDGTLPSTAESVATVEMQQRLAREVLALEEPCRSAVLWHYLHGLPVRTVAERLGVPADTVHKRIQRGLETLRTRLAPDPDRSGWLTLAALSRAPHRTFVLGAAFMNSKPLVIGLAIAVSAALGWTIWPRSEPVPQAPAREPALTASANPAAQPAATQRSEVAPAAAPEPIGEPAGRRIPGLLLDASGEPLADVALESVVDRTTSGTGGRFELRCQPDGDRVRVADPAWIDVYEGRVHGPATPGAGEAVVVVAARRLTVRGRVVDEYGAPLARVVAQVVPAAAFLTAFAAPLDHSEPIWPRWRTFTAADGTFTLTDIGALPGATITARAANRLPASAPLPPTGVEVELVLRRPPHEADAVLGQVVDPVGLPVAGALVCLGGQQTSSDADGRFRIVRPPGDAPGVLQAMRRGWQPATAPLPPPAADGRAAFVVLSLRAETLRLSGRVVDAAGAAVAGARVWADGATAFPGGRLQVEAYLGGGATNDELKARSDPAASLLQLQEDNPSAFWNWAQTGADGSFTLAGLLPRDYELGVLGDGDLSRAKAGPYAAGSSGLLVRFAPAMHGVVAGRVLGLDGSAKAGVDVEACCRVFTVDYDGGSSRSAVRHGPVCRSDALGRFRFGSLGAEGLFLAINGADIVDRTVGLVEGSLAAFAGGRVDELRIEVADRTHLRVELIADDFADAFNVADAAGATLPLASFEGGGMHVMQRGDLVGGKSRVYAVPATAAAVRLLRGERVVREVPVALVRGEVFVVHE
ncbi:MAG TPA: sigma-70 family RNA polymerase sigma factor [Planctomycetota bacterium]|nr:sigma-70 family RNA polymerase sigma factor [Planctomycetota bacterium]